MAMNQKQYFDCVNRRNPKGPFRRVRKSAEKRVFAALSLRILTLHGALSLLIAALFFASAFFASAGPIFGQYLPYGRHSQAAAPESTLTAQRPNLSAPNAAAAAESKSFPESAAPAPVSPATASAPLAPAPAPLTEAQSEAPLPSLEEVIAEKSMIEKFKPGEREERTYYPTRNDPKSLAERFLKLLPPTMRTETEWKVDPEKKSLTVTGPSQVIATADQLIPRMDSNLQLAEGMIDYGLAAPEAAPLQQPKTEAKPSEPYYDPNENRMVRVLYEPEGAILPSDSSQHGVAVLGEDRASAPTGEAAAETPDVVVYECSPQTIAVTVAKLKTGFAQCPEVMITSDPTRGKILVYTTRRRQEEIKAFLVPLGAQPITRTRCSERFPGARSALSAERRAARETL